MRSAIAGVTVLEAPSQSKIFDYQQASFPAAIAGGGGRGPRPGGRESRNLEEEVNLLLDSKLLLELSKFDQNGDTLENMQPWLTKQTQANGVGCGGCGEESREKCDNVKSVTGRNVNISVLIKLYLGLDLTCSLEPASF